jgi:hypothetical protein
VIAAAVCYIPANMLPMMATNTFASSDADTIMGGVVYLFASGLVAAGPDRPDRQRHGAAGQAGGPGLSTNQRAARHAQAVATSGRASTEWSN